MCSKVKFQIRPWWTSGLKYDVTAVKWCMVCVWSQVRIPLDRSESEMACHYSNSRAPGGNSAQTHAEVNTCCVIYWWFTAINCNCCGFTTIWEWGNPIDKAPQTNLDSQPRSEPPIELHNRAASSVSITSPFQQSQNRKQFWKKADNKKVKFFFVWRGEKTSFRQDENRF